MSFEGHVHMQGSLRHRWRFEPSVDGLAAAGLQFADWWRQQSDLAVLVRDGEPGIAGHPERTNLFQLRHLHETATPASRLLLKHYRHHGVESSKHD
jgi:hypothetical protein